MKILLTGGSACGKSTFAEKLAVSLPAPRYYIAAMKPYGDEGQKRIQRHREMRKDKGFSTIEQYTDMDKLILPSPGGVVLLECLCNLTANEMFRPDKPQENIVEKIAAGMDNLSSQCNTIIIITNDVGSGGNDGFDRETIRYIHILGELNKKIAEKSDTVAELVCGIPVTLKGRPIW